MTFSKVVLTTAVGYVAAQSEVEDEGQGHGHMHANGEMHYGDHGGGHEDHGHGGHGHQHADGSMHYGDHGHGDEGEGMENPNFDPDFVLTNEDFLKLTPDEFWNEVLPKLDHTKLDDIINTLDKDHLQKMISSMPGMGGEGGDHGHGGEDPYGGYGEEEEDLEAEDDADEPEAEL